MLGGMEGESFLFSIRYMTIHLAPKEKRKTCETMEQALEKENRVHKIHPKGKT